MGVGVRSFEFWNVLGVLRHVSWVFGNVFSEFGAFRTIEIQPNAQPLDIGLVSLLEPSPGQPLTGGGGW